MSKLLLEKITRSRWSQQEQNDAWKYFGSYLRADKLPGPTLIENVQAEKNILPGRPAKIINTWLSNQLRAIRRGENPEPAKNSGSKIFTEHIAFIFEKSISHGKVPSVRQCEEVCKNDSKNESSERKGNMSTR